MENLINLTTLDGKVGKFKAVAIDAFYQHPQDRGKSVLCLRGGQTIGVSESIEIIENRIKAALR